MTGWPLIPEAYFLLVAGVFFALALRPPSDARQTYLTALILTAGGLIVSLGALKGEGLFFSQVLRLDLFSQIFKVMLALGVFLVVCLCSELKSLEEKQHPEFYFLLALATLAMMILVSSLELLTIYVALELTGYSLYLLVPLRKGNGDHLEAGIKYFLMGASTSAVMLFGMALLYGALGTTSLTQLARMQPDLMGSPLVFTGLLFTLSGFFFKLALFPFHLWAPGAYQGAANQVTAFLATSTKVAAMALILRLVSISGGGTRLIHLLSILALASMTLGNLAALVQKNLKRLLGYSAIAQAGYVLIGILSRDQGGYGAVIFYALAYLIMNGLCFLVIVKVADQGQDLEIDHLRGLHRRSPLLALALLLGFFSLGGLPPTIGFSGKFLIFLAAMGKGYFYLVLVGMINVVVSLYYYALVIKAAYYLPAEEDRPVIILSRPVKLLTMILMIIVIGGGIFPAFFYDWALRAAQVLQ